MLLNFTLRLLSSTRASGREKVGQGEDRDSSEPYCLWTYSINYSDCRAPTSVISSSEQLVSDDEPPDQRRPWEPGPALRLEYGHLLGFKDGVRFSFLLQLCLSICARFQLCLAQSQIMSNPVVQLYCLQVSPIKLDIMTVDTAPLGRP